MPLSPDLADVFPEPVRARGEEYQRRHLVRMIRNDKYEINAEVVGSERYAVQIDSDERGRLRLSCTCPYAADNYVCKHLWATLLEADRAGSALLARTGGVAYYAETDPAFDNYDVASTADDDPIVGWIGPDSQRPRAIPRPAPRPGAAEVTRPAAWKQQLQNLRAKLSAQWQPPTPAPWPAGRRIAYVVNIGATIDPANATRGLIVELATQAPRRGRADENEDGWAPPKRFEFDYSQWLSAPDPADHEIMQLLLGSRSEYAYFFGASPKRFTITASAIELTLRRICETGRCFVRAPWKSAAQSVDPDLLALVWDAGGAWEIALTLPPARERENRRAVEGVLRRGDEQMSLLEPALVFPGIVIVRRGEVLTAAPLKDHGALDLANTLRAGTRVEVPDEDVLDLLAELHARPASMVPAVVLPPELGVEEVRVRPQPRVRFTTPLLESHTDKLNAWLAFDYAGTVIELDHASSVVVQRESRRLIVRDEEAEDAAVARLDQAGLKREYDIARRQHVSRLARSKVALLTNELADEGWIVELDGRVLRIAGVITLDVHSGIDWFDLAGSVDFGGVSATLPELLAALRHGQRTVPLGDGSLGVVPAEWIARYSRIAQLGASTEAAPGRLRFARGQVALLDALLATLPEARADEQFERAKAALLQSEGVSPLDPPAGFVGQLRHYQREGLGWLDALRRLGFGGCLADDMGLGKTVQALALLEMRRQADAGPSLVVVPRSLVFNWQQEAAHFTPSLRVLVYAGPLRRQELERLRNYDLVVTTYGTLRRDAAEFRDVEFDYAILDEAQAIKNASTATAKAARLLRARHRLAMSGTPIENRLAELWSLCEFLNPGMLGTAPVFQRIAKGAASDEQTRALIARAVRPFILRRTKEQVAPELPERVEQTVWVELDGPERKRYDELRDHYRASILGRIADQGLAKSKMHVLEALLRLRQAALHPGLIDKSRVAETSSKLEVLLSQVGEVIAEEHKAIVFSQFTSLLAIVRDRLDADGVPYAYLNGQTTDRQAVVERFQNDPECRLFLVSLKAGGLGLNLTAADYVFLLDPWWNPAVEAQAIDRAHRIGQTRRVIATRLIARDTVEEKVLELQNSKRELADAIIAADEGVVARLTREDLEVLLG